MGFMDKAKKLAEQAQEKLDEAQKSFNKSEGPQAPAADAGVRYDDHGRPSREEETAAAATQPPSARPAPDPTAPIDDPAPAEEAGAPPPPKPSEGGANTTPDPFKPIE